MKVGRLVTGMSLFSQASEEPARGYLFEWGPALTVMQRIGLLWDEERN